ncbi:50S ribosomal protein L3 [Methanocalculus chunghsingensis]|uniref:Large ribosomal subunit protein uL3 n=1 Tax=Methanocalculus chunghsingensis TaxID=156457 RepID=A0A8J7W891_9EURY|nr:50S ribosomal protein L3 [Methanocalculus chunghsingensis]MBR1369308.1 50S ribosomal protein L3 [Methanocalculus chunghsingensis]
MPKIHRPRSGSLAFSPRTRARSEVPKYKSWPKYTGKPVLQGFAGYKVGMTHVIMVDDHKSSPSEGKDIMIPVTVVEIPAMKVAAIRAYRKDTYGKHPMTEVWAESLNENLSHRITMPKNHDRQAALQAINDAVAADSVVEFMLLMHTTPEVVTGIPKKVPDLMEIRIAGGTAAERFAYAQELLGKEVDFASIMQEGAYADITAVTTGKGTQGAVKRWGISIRKRKHSRGKKKRHIGTLGPWTPHHVRWQVPNVGQMGYQQRTEYNKRIIKIGGNGEEINPEGGFLHYGLVRNNYLLIKGSIPGPVKRIIRIRPAIRQGEHEVRVPTVEYVSLESKQG